MIRIITIFSIFSLMVAMPFTALSHADITRQSGVAPVIAGVQELKGAVVDENKTPISFAKCCRA